MIILGLVLLLLGLLLDISILWTIGIVVLIVGLVLLLLGSTGRAVGGRRHFFCRSRQAVKSGPGRCPEPRAPAWTASRHPRWVGAAGIEPATARL